jgi:predicted PurR-regulated permease PerM
VLPRDPNEPRAITWLRNPHVLANLIFAFLWLSIAVVLLSFHAVLLPFGIAVLVAFVIEPIVRRATSVSLARRSPPRLLVIISLYLVSGFVLYELLSVTLPQLGHELARLAAESKDLIRDLEHRFAVLLDNFDAFAQENQIPIERAQVQAFVRGNLESIAEQIRTNAGHVFTLGQTMVASVFRTVFGVFLVLMLTAFMSLDRPRIAGFARSMVAAEHQKGFDEIVGGIADSLGGVVRGQLLICLTNGILTFIGLVTLEVKFPFVLALVAMTFSLVPIFGSILSTVPIVAIALAESPPKAVFVLLWIIGIHLIEANLLNPKIMGDASKIHPLIVVFVLMVGERTAGLIGALFAVPIASVVVTMFKFLHRRALASSMRSGAVLRPAAETEPGPGPSG